MDSGAAVHFSVSNFGRFLSLSQVTASVSQALTHFLQ